MPDQANDPTRRQEYQAGAAKLRSRPDIISIESTNHCNLKCIMCPRGEPDIMTRGLGSMDDDLFRKIVEGWDTWHEPVWFHMFGEPLMHPRFFEQVRIAKAAGVPNLATSSNATLLTLKRAERLCESGLDKIILAIDGNTKETYEQIRKSTEFTFEEVCENVRQFLGYKGKGNRPLATVQIIVMDETRAQLEAFRERWMAAGADEVLFKEFCGWGSQTEHFSILAPDGRRIGLANPRKHPCYYLWQGVTVCWDGRVVPCCYDYDATMTMGNLREQSLMEIWNSQAYQDLRAKEFAGKNDSPLCMNCSEAPGPP